MKKKIIISTYDSITNPYYCGGGAVVVHEIAKRLSAKYDIVVLFGNYKGARRSRIDGVDYRPAKSFTWGPKLSQLAYHLSLPYYAKSLEYDLWVESFTPPFSTSFTPLFTKKPVVGLAQMLTAKDMERKYRLPFGLVERAGLQHYSNLIVLSEFAKEEILRINGKAGIRIIPNGIEKIPAEKKGKGRHLLFMGRLEYDQKGLDLLIEAYAKVKNKIKVNLVIAGNGNSVNENLIKDVIKKHHLEKRIILAGRVAGKEKEMLFRDTVSLILPSRFDTYPLVVMEAFSYKVPVVCFNLPQLSWIPDEASVKVKAYDTAALGNAMLHVSVNKKGRDKMGLLGQRFVKDKTMDNIAAEYKNYFGEILNYS